MIYAISDSELQALVACAGYTCKTISPLYDYVDATKINYGKTFEERAENLRNLGLMAFDSSDHYLLTAEGALMLKVLLQPDCVASIGRKKTGGDLVYAMKKENIWYVLIHVPDKKMYFVGAYFSSVSLAKWLDEQFLDGWRPDLPGVSKLDLTLSYEEWYLFLASQFLFDTRERLEAEHNEYFTMDDIFASKAFVFIKNAFDELGVEENKEAIELFFNENAREAAEQIKMQLVEKGVFCLFEDSEGREVISYSESAICWLDNDFLLDSLYFNFKKDDGEYTALFALRRTGISAFFDRETDMRVMSTSQIPWEFYMR